VFHRIDAAQVEIQYEACLAACKEKQFERPIRTYATNYTTTRRKMARYGKAAGKSVKSAMHKEKRGTLKSGKGGKGGTVTSRKQAIAIGLSEARKKGAKVPKKKSS
jgi:uncharacterized protein DUF6496